MFVDFFTIFCTGYLENGHLHKQKMKRRMYLHFNNDSQQTNDKKRQTAVVCVVFMLKCWVCCDVCYYLGKGQIISEVMCLVYMLVCVCLFLFSGIFTHIFHTYIHRGML